MQDIKKLFKYKYILTLFFCFILFNTLSAFEIEIKDNYYLIKSFDNILSKDNKSFSLYLVVKCRFTSRGKKDYIEAVSHLKNEIKLIENGVYLNEEEKKAGVLKKEFFQSFLDLMYPEENFISLFLYSCISESAKNYDMTDIEKYLLSKNNPFYEDIKLTVKEKLKAESALDFSFLEFMTKSEYNEIIKKK